MGIGEISPPFRQRIHMRSQRPGMPSQKSRPIVEVIDANHEDIGSRCILC